jgi:hypothetical protein
MHTPSKVVCMPVCVCVQASTCVCLRLAYTQPLHLKSGWDDDWRGAACPPCKRLAPGFLREEAGLGGGRGGHAVYLEANDGPGLGHRHPPLSISCVPPGELGLIPAVLHPILAQAVKMTN